MQRARDTQGFTLIELLVVILIVGILAAIALPAFLSQRQKAQDVDAKSQARNVVSLMEVCYQRDVGYTGCWAGYLAEGTGLPMGSGPGQVEVTIEEPQGYQIVATSKASTGGTQHRFTINHNVGGLLNKTCNVPGKGGCGVGGGW